MLTVVTFVVVTDSCCLLLFCSVPLRLRCCDFVSVVRVPRCCCYLLPVPLLPVDYICSSYCCQFCVTIYLTFPVTLPRCGVIHRRYYIASIVVVTVISDCPLLIHTGVVYCLVLLTLFHNTFVFVDYPTSLLLRVVALLRTLFVTLLRCSRVFITFTLRYGALRLLIYLCC